MAPMYVLAPHVFQRGFADERVLLDMNSGDYFALNPSGAWMLDALLEGDTIEGVAARASAHFEVSSEQAKADLTALVAEMSTRGLLQQAESASK